MERHTFDSAGSTGSATPTSAATSVASVAHVACAQPEQTIPEALEAVHAGFPSVAQDYFISDFSFDEHIITHPATTFVVRVAGDSMVGAGIFDGDLLLVDRSLTAHDGDVIIAALDGELTVKRLLLRGHSKPPILHPENPHYPNITLHSSQDFLVWGVVIGNYHFQRPREEA